MALTYEPIATQLLTSTASSITFSSIPATYTDLKVVVFGIGSTINSQRVVVNGDTGTNYVDGSMNASGGTTAGNSNANVFGYFSLGSALNPFTTLIDFPSYTNTSNYKTMLATQTYTYTTGGLNIISGTWQSTAAISSLQFSVSSGVYSVGTMITLYGIKAA